MSFLYQLGRVITSDAYIYIFYFNAVSLFNTLTQQSSEHADMTESVNCGGLMIREGWDA